MVPTWVPSGSQNPTKIDPGAPWQPLGRQDNPKLASGDPKYAQIDPKWIILAPQPGQNDLKIGSYQSCEYCKSNQSYLFDFSSEKPNPFQQRGQRQWA